MTFDKNALLLYAVTDRAWLHGRTLAEQVRACLRGGVTCLQLREKDLNDDAFLQEALQIKAICESTGVPFIINDNVAVAVGCAADGLHVGQGDLRACDARQALGGDKILGVSVQTVEQALCAERDGADYLGVGAIFPTDTKKDADAVSFESLQNICRAVSIPVVAIGGINRHNIGRLKGTGIAGVAVVSALFAESDIEGAAKTLRALSAEMVHE
ncbi:thiamine phosphate synthase [Oscillospiraceae bacterium CM]|nr:thiamine phosphate synthase [Oscillospiraceae bacterium CM]